jgi:hypothetical protein
MESFGTAALRLLAGLGREAERKAKKASERPQNGSEKFDAGASRGEDAQTPASRRREDGRDGLERDASGVVEFGSRIKELEMRPLATNADSYLNDFTAITEGRIIDARWIFAQVGERRVSGARGRTGIVVPFPVRSVAWEW